MRDAGSRSIGKLLVGLALVAAGCGGGADVVRPEGVLPKDSFVMVLAEVQLVEAAGNQRAFRNDDENQRLSDAYNDVWHRTGVSASRFEESHTWWWSHPELMEGVLEDVVDALRDLENDYDTDPSVRRRPNKKRPFPSKKPQQ